VSHEEISVDSCDTVLIKLAPLPALELFHGGKIHLVVLFHDLNHKHTDTLGLRERLGAGCLVPAVEPRRDACAVAAKEQNWQKHMGGEGHGLHHRQVVAVLGHCS
jgi:hypothetical protein